jgi:pyruvate dehydrogenase E2 component (dihydrolipoamide acetyltransferase)
MAIEVILPRVDMDMATGKLGRWHATEGERVREGQLLFEIETDKAAMEIEAPASGLLRGVRAQAGDVLPVGAILAWIVGEGEAFDPDLQALAGELRALLGPGKTADDKTAQESAPTAPEAGEPAPSAIDEPQRATPLARRLARARGFDLSGLAGSGPQGRVQARDVPATSDSPLAAPTLTHGAGARLNREWLRRGEGAPLALIHGFGADLNGWRPLVGRLPETIGALAIDLPGHGASTLTGAPTLAGLVAAVAATLAEEGVASAHLVGHSLGGAVATALAAEPGFRALSLALIAPAGLGPEVNAAFLSGFLRARSVASLTPWIRLLAADPEALGPALVKSTLRQRASGELVEAQTRIAEALFPDGVQAIDLRPLLATLAIPAKIIVGAEDRIIPSRQAEGLSGTIALHRFRNVGHMPHLEARGEVARLIEELVKAGGA